MANVTIKRWDTGAVIAEGPRIRELGRESQALADHLERMATIAGWIE